jgi:hypothetical protein
VKKARAMISRARLLAMIMVGAKKKKKCLRAQQHVRGTYSEQTAPAQDVLRSERLQTCRIIASLPCCINGGYLMI